MTRIGTPRRSRWLEVLAVSVVCYLMIVVLFRDLVFAGRVFAGSGDTLPATILERWGRSLMEQGIFPLWNPWIFSGMPSFGSLQFTPGVYPVTWLRPLYHALFLSASSSTILVHHLIGGVLAWLMLRDLDLERGPAALGALVFFFTPQVVALGPVSHGGKLFTLTWLPLLFLLCRRVLRRPDLLETVLLGVATGLTLLALHVQIAYYGMMLMGLYLIVDAVQHRRDRGWKDHGMRLGALVGAGVIALALAAYLLWPVYEYSQYSIRGGSAVGGGVSYDYATSWSFHPLESLTFLVPSWFGFGGASYWGYMPFTDHPYYFGLIPLLLAGVALILERRERTVQVLAVVGGVALLVSFGRWLPILYAPLFRLLPYFAKFRIPAMILILFVLSAAALSAFGLAALLRLQGEARGAWRRRLGWAAAGLGTLFLVVLVGRGTFESGYLESAIRRILARQGLNPPGVAQAAYGLFWIDALRVTGTSAVGALLLFLHLGGRLPSRVAVAGVVLLVGVDLWTVDARFVNTIPRQDRSAELEPNSEARFLQQQEGPFRIVSLGLPLPGNYWMSQGIEDIQGYSPAKLGIYQRLLDNTLQRPQGAVLTQPLLGILNVRYLVLGGEVPWEWVEEVYASQGVHIYEFAGAMGPAWLVGRAARVQDDDAVLSGILQGVDLSGRVLTTEVIAPLDTAAARTGSVELLERGPHALRYLVRADGPVLLVMSEVHYPAGWKAEVDGAPAPIHRVDHVLRAVRVEPPPGGVSEVTLRFEPRSVLGGRWLSRLAFLVVIVLGATGFVLRRRRGMLLPGDASADEEAA